MPPILRAELGEEARWRRTHWSQERLPRASKQHVIATVASIPLHYIQVGPFRHQTLALKPKERLSERVNFFVQLDAADRLVEQFVQPVDGFAHDFA